MADLNRKLPHVDSSHFSMIPRSEIPRSTFVTQHTYKTTFDPDYLIPIYVDEVLPADVFQGDLTIFARLATPLFPIMDNITLETFFFFVPNRLVWDNWRKMMGERKSPSDSISYQVPRVDSDAGGFLPHSLGDYFGLPTNTGATHIFANALPFRAYNLIWNEWFRDENLQNAVTVNTGDADTLYINEFPAKCLKRNKPHDYFTSALPWPQKGGQDVSMPLSGIAWVKGFAVNNTMAPVAGNPGAGTWLQADGNQANNWNGYWLSNSANIAYQSQGTAAGSRPGIYADLSTATGATINALRLAFQTQRLLERDARGGTRYTELLRAHFGVMPEDARLQRPEYIGGGKTSFQTSAIPQTSATGATGTTSPLGALGAASTAADQHSFSYHATEHGFILGLINVRGDVTYQQGMHRMWTRRTRYDYFWPVFSHLGEQAIRNDEIYCDGSANDLLTFGYQERWAEYKHRISRITGKFRSNATGTMDPWHLAENFLTRPALNGVFIQQNTPLARDLAGVVTTDQMILLDSVFRIKTTRAMPMFSVPGNIDRF